MGKSARVLGWEFGRTAREMNALLKAYGYLHGEPGAYGLTEKGEQYGDEQYNDNGYGGYAHRSWETRTWSDELADALRADIEAHPDGLAPQVVESAPEPDATEPTHEVDTTEDEERGGGFSLNGKQVAAVAGVVAAVSAIVVVAPHVKPFWNHKVKPAAHNIGRKFSKQEVEAKESTPAQPDETE